MEEAEGEGEGEGERPFLLVLAEVLEDLGAK